MIDAVKNNWRGKSPKAIINDLSAVIFSREMLFLPGNLALFCILSLIPIFMLLSYIMTAFRLDPAWLIGYIEAFLPEIVAEILVSTTQSGFGSGAGAWFVTALILASNGIHSVIICSDALYGFNQLNLIVRRAKAAGLTILLIIVITAGLFALGFGEYLIATGPWNRVFSVLKVPIVIILMFLIVRFIYAVTPRKSVPFRHTAAGAAFTSLGWAIATAIYSFYQKYFGNYDL